MDKKEQTVFKKNDGGYIFISHSHMDIDKVRIIRNTLERQGFEPLCFYLKCLTDDDEIEGLIKREIDSRDIFIYVESENSKQSTWVNKEREYISGCKDKTIHKITLNDDIDLVNETMRIIQKSSVYISYAHQDEIIASKIKDHLIKNDLKVFYDFDSLSLGSWEESLKRAIEEACTNGCFLYLVTTNSLKSNWVQAEINYAMKVGADSIAFVVIGNPNEPAFDEFRLLFGRYNWLFVNENLLEEDLNIITERVKQVLKNKI